MGVIWADLGIMLESFEPIWGEHVSKNGCNMFYLCPPPETALSFDKFRSHYGSRFLLVAISSSANIQGFLVHKAGIDKLAVSCIRPHYCVLGYTS